MAKTWQVDCDDLAAEQHFEQESVAEKLTREDSDGWRYEQAPHGINVFDEQGVFVGVL